MGGGYNHRTFHSTHMKYINITKNKQTNTFTHPLHTLVSELRYFNALTP
jgi:hypothetical protein